MRIIWINLERLFVNPLRLAPTAQAHVQIGGLQKQARPHQMRFRHSFQRRQRFRIPFLRHQNLRLQIIDHRRLVARQIPPACQLRRALRDLPLRLFKQRPPPAIQIIHNAPHFLPHPQRLRGNEQSHRKPLLVRIGRIQLAENLVRFPVPVGVLIGFAQVIAELADGLPNRYFAILIRTLDIPQRNHLLQRFMRRHRIQTHMRRMAPVHTRNFLPARNQPNLRRFGEGLHKHLPVHILAHRQSVKRQYRRRNVQHRRPMQ